MAQPGAVEVAQQQLGQQGGIYKIDKGHCGAQILPIRQGFAIVYGIDKSHGNQNDANGIQNANQSISFHGYPADGGIIASFL